MSHVNIEFTLFSAFYSPLIVTMAGGFLEQEGLEYSWTVSPPGKSAIESLHNGSAHVVQSAASQGFHPNKEGRSSLATHFAQVNEMDGFFVVGREADTNFSWKQLEGAEVVMFKGGQPNVMFQYACHKANIDYNKIIPITPGGPNAMEDAFREGKGQYIQQQGPSPQQLQQEGFGHIVAMSGPLIGPCAFSSLAALPEWLETEQAIAFCNAYRKARTYLNQASPDEVAELEHSFFPNIELNALTQCIKTYQELGCWSAHIEITESAFDATLGIYLHTGSIAERIPFSNVCSMPPGHG